MRKTLLKSKKSLENDRLIFSKQRFDCMLSPDDDRDYDEKDACIALICDLPKEYISKKTKILDQEKIGSCVAHASSTILSQNDAANFGKYNEYSRGFIYANRSDSDWQGEGMHTREALKHLNHDGVCLHCDFPYNDEYRIVKNKLLENKEELYSKASQYRITSYYRCNNVDEIKRSIYNYGGCLCVVNVYSDFSRDLHNSTSKVLKGAHAMCIIGWTEDDRWIVQNSWGKDWGYNGLLYMDFDYKIKEAWGVIANNQTKPKSAFIRFIFSIFQKLVGLFK